jgi:thiosulfate/3-mercaptopyruvate sulfurtransferase
MKRLVETSWVASNITKLKPVDGSWHMNSTGRSALDEFKQKHLPNARFFDLDLISDRKSSLPHMLPSASEFENAMEEMSISSDDHVIVYDNSDVFSAFRVYWTFRAFGHERVSVMNGGLAKWIKEARPLSSGEDIKQQTKYKTAFNENMVRSYEQVKMNVLSQNELLLDARSKGRFDGTQPEPRVGLRSGHIPNSLNLPFQELIDKDRCLKSDTELKEIFNNLKVDIKRPIITSCGSGVTAAVIYFALEQVGAENVALYDGSWTEWANKNQS